MEKFTQKIKGVSFEMIPVEGGTFQMGATPEQMKFEEYSPESPAHPVYVSSFYLSKTPVTQQQYEAIMGENPSTFQGNDLPVHAVDRCDARAFCEKLSKLTGKHYVLPTEAQWEYAARGGRCNEKTIYAGSNKGTSCAWFDADQPEPVATQAPNALGLYDMSGNVWEWCADYTDHYSPLFQINPRGKIRSSYIGALRGGSYDYPLEAARVACRRWDRDTPAYLKTPLHYGFRIAMIPEESVGEVLGLWSDQELERIQKAEAFILENYQFPLEKMPPFTWNFVRGKLWVSIYENPYPEPATYVKFRGKDSLTNALFSWYAIEGTFDCSDSPELLSLEGGPMEVSAHYICSHCSSISSLRGAPTKVIGDFTCSSCDQLASLAGAPTYVGGNFTCSHCFGLTSLEGIHQKIEGDFNCSYCPNLRQLQGPSTFVGGKIIFFGTTQLASMPGMPLVIGPLLDNTQLAYDSEEVNGVSFDMVYVEGGSFEMGVSGEGDPEGIFLRSFKPAHPVQLSSFYLSKTVVSQAQYQAVMGENPSTDKAPNLPVQNVSWMKAMTFCKKLSQLTGKHYVLPTEAQWEYAARGGKYCVPTRYSGRILLDEVPLLHDLEVEERFTVDEEDPNVLGLYYLNHRVWEWCYDIFGFYPAERQVNPKGPRRGNERVLRGRWNYSGQKNLYYASDYTRMPSADVRKVYCFRVALIP